ncbi:MAG TPA: AAA family ATPase [Terriglobia bacterium]|nr:AAA family ATPase [Terriglobia bacterium]
MSRTPPHDEHAEKMILGNCLMGETAAPLAGLEPGVFYRPSHQDIAAEILRMDSEGEPINSDRLARRLDPARVSPVLIAELTDGMPVYPNLTFYRNRIIQCADWRRGAASALRLQQAYVSANPDSIRQALEELDTLRAQGSDGRTKTLRAVSLRELLSMNLPPRGMLLDPVIPEQGLSLLYAKRGVGKTHLALGIVVAVASGSQFLRWTAPSPQPVLYIDGELPASLLQKWCAEIANAIGTDAGAENLRIITPDLQNFCIPDLSTRQGQDLLRPDVERARLVVLDNLSALCRTGNENEAEAWLPLQEWGLSLRRAGKSVLFLHHAGHQGKNQRGTSKREDLLDTIIALRNPPDYDPTDGLSVEVHLEEGRDLFGRKAKSFAVQLVTGDKGSEWAIRDLEASMYDKACSLFDSGGKVPDAIEELKLPRSTAFKFQRRWREQSQVSPSMVRDCETAEADENEGQH